MAVLVNLISHVLGGLDMIYLVLALLILIYAFIYTQRIYRSPLANAPLTKADHFSVKYLGLVPPPNQAETTDSLSKFLIREGSTLPLSVCWSLTGSPLVLVNSLKGIKDVLIDGQGKSKTRDKEPKVQRGNLIRLIQNLVFGGKSINNVIGEDWRWRRHVLLPFFQPKQLVPKLLPYVTARTNELLKIFAKQAASGEAIELDDIFMDMTMDVINYYLYGRTDLNYELTGGKNNLKHLHNQLGLGFQSIETWLPFSINKTNWAQRSFKPSRTILKRFIRESIHIAQMDYEKAKAQYDRDRVPERDRSYQSVAACAIASDKYEPNLSDLVNDFLSLTFAGYDTTAHTLSFAFSELARNRQLQDQVFQQVRSVLGPPPVSPESVTPEKLARMPLVTNIYRETLRKYPAVVFIPVHVNHDTIVDGAVVPSGAEIWCNVRGVQMNPTIFPDPEKFDPSRWNRPEGNIEHDDAFDSLSGGNQNTAIITPETQYAFPDLSFTLGKHACLGKNLAVLELRTVIACAMNEYTCHLKENSVIDTKVVLTTKPRYGVWTHFQKRE